jgi:hypothetical protein|tara:strand:- start:326 stop:541 length:216 start_codon:yes stop_codon:yes gene_type:complete
MMSEVSDLEIGKLIQKVDSLETMVREQNDRLDKLDQQLERTRGIGIGVVLATVGLSGIGGSLFTRWLSGGG